jgi:hypothetical protein
VDVADLCGEKRSARVLAAAIIRLADEGSIAFLERAGKRQGQAKRSGFHQTVKPLRVSRAG